MKADLFQSCGHSWVFQICWHFECSTFTASPIRIWNSSTGIPSPPLGFFVVMFPKAHLTSHSRMSGSRWVITPLWLSGLWRSLFVQFYSSSVYSCHLFLVSSASVRSLPLLSFIEPIFVWNVSLVSRIFLKRSLLFPILCHYISLSISTPTSNQNGTWVGMAYIWCMSIIPLLYSQPALLLSRTHPLSEPFSKYYSFFPSPETPEQ